jgi:hypothetical protein
MKMKNFLLMNCKEYSGSSLYPQATRGECSNSCIAFFRSNQHE